MEIPCEERFPNAPSWFTPCDPIKVRKWFVDGIDGTTAGILNDPQSMSSDHTEVAPQGDGEWVLSIRTLFSPKAVITKSHHTASEVFDDSYGNNDMGSWNVTTDAVVEVWEAWGYLSITLGYRRRKPEGLLTLFPTPYIMFRSLLPLSFQESNGTGANCRPVDEPALPVSVLVDEHTVDGSNRWNLERDEKLTYQFTTSSSSVHMRTVESAIGLLTYGAPFDSSGMIQSLEELMEFLRNTKRVNLRMSCQWTRTFPDGSDGSGSFTVDEVQPMDGSFGYGEFPEFSSLPERDDFAWYPSLIKIPTVGFLYDNVGEIWTDVKYFDDWDMYDQLSDSAFDTMIRRLNNGEVNMLITMGSMKQTSQMILSRIQQLNQVLVAIRKKDLAALQRIFQNAVGPSAGRRTASLRPEDLLLEYRFGWVQLIKDINGLIEQLMKGLHEDGYILSASGTALSDNELLSRYFGTSFSLDLVDPPKRVKLLKGNKTPDRQMRHYELTNTLLEPQCGVRWQTVWKVTDSYKRLLHDLGITTPLIALWDLIPYSFIADWVLNINDFLARTTFDQALEPTDANTYSEFFTDYVEDRTWYAGGEGPREWSLGGSVLTTYRFPEQGDLFPEARVIDLDFSSQTLLTEFKVTTSAALLKQNWQRLSNSLKKVIK